MSRIPILKLKMKDGSFRGILGIKGDKGDPGDDIFWAEYEKTPFAEIEEAYNAGKVLVLKRWNNTAYSLGNQILGNQGDYFSFTGSGTYNLVHYIVYRNDTWKIIDTGSFELKIWKVNTVTNNDAEYPTTKAVRDYAQPKLIAGDGITIAEDGKTISVSGSGGDSNIYIAEYGQATFQEIVTAYNAGKTVIVHILEDDIHYYCPLLKAASASVTFYGASNHMFIYAEIRSTGRWSVQHHSVPIIEQWADITLSNNATLSVSPEMRMFVGFSSGTTDINILFNTDRKNIEGKFFINCSKATPTVHCSIPVIWKNGPPALLGDHIYEITWNSAFDHILAECTDWGSVT